MKLAKLIDELEKEFPPNSAWSGDSIGLQVDSGQSDINKIYITLELDNNSIKEAIAKEAQLIVTFHPLIFNPLDRIENGERVSDILRKLIKNDISLYCIHTNLDSHPEGTNKYLCDKLDLIKCEYLEPLENIDNRGMGLIVKPDEPLTIEQLSDRISTICNSPLRVSNISNKKVERIALLAGSGANYIKTAIKKECDAIITADVKYHDFHAANGKIAIFDPGHYEMEQFVIESLHDNMKRILNEVEIEFFKCTTLTNPVRYYPEGNYIEEQQQNLKK